METYLSYPPNIFKIVLIQKLAEQVDSHQSLSWLLPSIFLACVRGMYLVKKKCVLLLFVFRKVWPVVKYFVS